MFPYFYVSIEHLGEFKKFVTCNTSEQNIRTELNIDYPNSVVLDVKQYPELNFCLVAPAKVEKGIHGYNIRQHFFKQGVICVDIDDFTYFVDYHPYPEPKLIQEDDFETFEIGLAVVTDQNNVVLHNVVLEDIDEGHLIDRLTAELIKFHESKLEVS